MIFTQLNLFSLRPTKYNITREWQEIYARKVTEKFYQLLNLCGMKANL